MHSPPLFVIRWYITIDQLTNGKLVDAKAIKIVVDGHAKPPL